MTTLSRPSSAPKAAAAESALAQHRVFGWDKQDSAVPAQRRVRFTCRPTNVVGSPQFRTDWISLADLGNPDPARYDTLDRIAGYWARTLETHFASGKIDPTTDPAWSAFSTEVASLPSCLCTPKSAT